MTVWVGSRRVKVIKKRDDFGIIIAKTRGACVIAIIWTGRKWAMEQDGLGG
jgi:threonine/homoserine efflux transporter RhtA